MNKKWCLLSSLILVACTASAGCVFTVDYELDEQSEQTDPDQPDDDQEPDPDPDVSVLIQGPNHLLVDPDDFTVEYDIECSPEGCEDDLWCRIVPEDVGDDDPSFHECISPFELDENDLSEGHYTAEVELRFDDEEPVADATDTTIQYDFDAGIDGLDPQDLNPFSHPHIGVFTADCTHPDCVIETCEWRPPVDADVDCSLDDEFTIEWTDQLTADSALRFEACSANFSHTHCVTTEYEFEQVAPSWDLITTYNRHSCGILSDQTLWCWGDNEDGQLGIEDDVDDVYEPRRVDVEPSWRDVSTGDRYTCAVTASEQNLYCWGDNTGGAVAPSAPEDTVLGPTLIDDEHSWKHIDAGAFHSCGVTESGRLLCWGNPDRHFLEEDDVPVTEVELPPGSNATEWVDVSAGSHHSCAIARTSDDLRRLFCWGNDNDGRLGVGPTNDDLNRPAEVQFDADLDIASAVAAFRHSCAVAVDNNDETHTYCWGHNTHDQLGITDDDETDVPRMVTDGTGLTSVDAGTRHSCAIRESDGQLMCWGDPSDGRLGDGRDDGDTVEAPHPVLSDKPFDTLSVGIRSGCAITDGGQLHCWGDNDGQLGVGDDAPRLEPHPINWPH